jgi:predicted transcriptional regulator
VALQGTIQDFALPDIFQLIGMQRKTGVLTLEQEQDRVTIKFLKGHVVEADTESVSLEDRIGTVLVRTGRITQSQLDEALRIQRNTLQRLGHILVKRGFVSQEELIDALQIQSSQIIFRLFRWREGSYHFDAVDELDYDHNHSTPMSSETILMEGARMVDEWPIIERRIPSDQVVLRKSAAAEELLAQDGSTTTPGAPGAVDDLDFDLGVDLDLSVDPEGDKTEGSPEPSVATSITLSDEERQVLALVDGKRTVREIADLLNLAEFETFRALSEMLTRSLLERVETSVPAKQVAAGARWVAPLLGFLARLTLLAAAVAGLASLPGNRHAPWTVVADAPTTERLRLYAAMARLDRIENAVRVFYLDAGTFPSDLETLVDYGYLDGASLNDPWGRPYLLQLSSGGYQLVGRDAEGAIRPELTVSRGFSAVQRMLVESPEAE